MMEDEDENVGVPTQDDTGPKSDEETEEQQETVENEEHKDEEEEAMYVSLEDSKPDQPSSSMMEEIDVKPQVLTAPGGFDEYSVDVEMPNGNSIADLQVLVKNPRKMNADNYIGSYVAFEVLTKTTRPNYGGEEINVLRRYSDFLWLREQLSYEFPTRLLPPLPPKSDIARVVVDKFSEAFLAVRCASLQRFMTRLVEHPILNCSQCLRCFLVTKAKEFATAKKEYERSLMSRMNESVSRLASKIMQKQPDPQMVQLQEQVEDYGRLMVQLEGACDGTHNSYYDLQRCYTEMGATMRVFAEGNDDLHDDLMDLQNIMEQQGEGYRKLLKTMPSTFTEPIRDYRRFADSFKTTIDKHKALQVDAEVLRDMLSSEKKKLGDIVRPHGAISDSSAQKKQTTESQVATLGLQVEQATNSVEIAKSDLVADLDRWTLQKVGDFRDMFGSHAKANVEFLTSSLDMWDNLIYQLQEE